MVVTYQELKPQANENNLVERIRAEKEVLLHKVSQEGFELGIRSASRLSYKDFQHFERVSPLATAFDEDVLDYLWTYLDTRGYPQTARIHEPDFGHLLEVSPQSRILFAQGWIDGVTSVWQTIKNQVEAN